jgi:hypothetical protein
LIKTLNKLGIEGRFLNIIKSFYEKPIANLKINEEQPKGFSVRPSAR